MATEEGAPNTNDATAKKSAGIPIFPILNTVAILAAAGLLYYSKFLNKRPLITEAKERKRLTEIKAAPALAAIPAWVTFEAMTVNVKDNSEPLIKDNQNKPHYATVGFTVQIRDQNQKDFFNSLKPFILDKFVQTLGKKQVQELTTIQGRYLLSSEMIDFVNQLAITRSTTPSREPFATNIYFNEFLVQ
jgi:flagellar basal body-associated protein FliL